MKKILSISLFFLLTSLSNLSFGQQYQRILNIGYSGGYTFGDVNNFIKGKNFDGVTLDGRYFLRDNISIGGSTGWSSFSKRFERQIYQVENGEISAVQTRYLRSIPLLLNAHYYLGKDGDKIIPYVGSGIGVYQIRYEKWYGAFLNGKDSWAFGVRPEAGILIPFSDKVGINANFRYNYAFYSFSEIKNNLSYIEGMVGLFFYFY